MYGDSLPMLSPSGLSNRKPLPLGMGYITRLKVNGTTVAQITHSLMGVLTVVSGVSDSEIAGTATKKESDKIADLIAKIGDCLYGIGRMVNGEQAEKSA